MSIGSIAITGGAATDYARTTTCGTTLATGASCTIDVTFTPTASGVRPSTLSVSGNQANNPATVPLSGNAPLPPGTLFQDAFENGLDAWTLSQWHLGAISIGGGRTGHGVFLWPNRGPEINMSTTFPGQGQPQTHTRFWESLANQFQSQLAQGTNANGQLVWEVDYDPRLARLAVYVWNSSQVRTDTYVNNFVPTGWTGFDVDLLQAASGHFRLSVNGTTVASVNGNFSATSNYSRLWFWETSTYGSISLDDVSVTVS
jgi:hypothetical protein